MAIARELPDVVAHHMSVASLQAGVAEHLLDGDPPAARTAVVTAGSSRRDALTETRCLPHLLRPPEKADDGAVPLGADPLMATIPTTP